MAADELTVVARFKAKQGKDDEVLREIRTLISPTRAEEGCINYDLHRSKDDPTLFFLYETWASRRDLDQHLAMPYLQAFLEKAPSLLAEEVNISMWDMI